VKIPVTLETSDGCLVGYADVLPFDVPPDVLFWGERVFKLHQDTRDYVGGELKGRAIYREAFVFALEVNVVRERL